MIINDLPTQKAQSIIEALSHGKCPNEVRVICNIVLSFYDNDIDKVEKGGLSNEVVDKIHMHTMLGRSTIRSVFDKVRSQLARYCSQAEANRIEPLCVGTAKMFFGQMCALSSFDYIELQQEIRILKSEVGKRSLEEISPLLSNVFQEAENPEDPGYPGRRVDCSEMYITQTSKRLIRLMAIDEVLSTNTNGDLGYTGGMSMDELQEEVDNVIEKRYCNIINADDAKINHNDFVVIRAMFSTGSSILPHSRSLFLLRGKKYSYTSKCMSAFFITLSCKEASIIASELERFSDIIMEYRRIRDDFPLLRALYLYGKSNQHLIRKDKIGIVDYYSNSYAVLNMAIENNQWVTIVFNDRRRESYRPLSLKDHGEGWSVVVEGPYGEEMEIPCSGMLTISLAN